LAIESIDEDKVGVIEHDGFGSLDLLKTEERRKYIEMALDKMGEQQRVLIQLFYLEELSIQEIIDVTGFKLSSVKTGLLRARQNLLKHLNIVLKDEVNSLL
jgi:RNA polymerase sigma-70 factor (ECF subfamily)